METQVRTMGDLRKVLPSNAKFDSKAIAYVMHRDMSNLPSLKDANCRYDITIIPAWSVAGQFAKTHGHYHVGQHGEACAVLSGKALFVLQRYEDIQHIDRADYMTIEAEMGEGAVIEAGYGNVRYGHVTVNVGSSPLVLANIVSNGCEPQYHSYSGLGGAAVFIPTWSTKKPNYAFATRAIKVNKRYASVKMLREVDSQLNDQILEDSASLSALVRVCGGLLEAYNQYPDRFRYLFEDSEVMDATRPDR